MAHPVGQNPLKIGFLLVTVAALAALGFGGPKQWRHAFAHVVPRSCCCC